MKYTLALIIIFATTFGIAARFAPKAVSERRISIGETPVITLMKDGNIQFDLVMPTSANSAVKNAGNEFTQLLSTITGAQIEIVSKPSKRPAIIVGDPEFARANGVAPDEIDRDGFVIRTIGDRVLLIGPDALDPECGRGTLFAVYDFLERFADCRFYFPGEIGTLLPRKTEWSLPQIDIVDRPDNQYRKIYWHEYGKPMLPQWYDDTDKNKATEVHRKRLRLSAINLPNCHGLAYLNLVQRFAKTNPEYFALRDDNSRHDGSRVNSLSDRNGQICFSNPELAEVIYQDAKALLSGESAKSRGIVQPDGSSRWRLHKKPFFSLMPNDAMYRCRCSGCWPHFSESRQTGGEFLWNWKLNIVNRLKDEKIPGYVTMMAYDLCKTPPKAPIPDNAVIQLAVNGPWNEVMPDKQEKDDKLIDDWCAKTGAKIYLWNYPTKFCLKNIPLIPNHTPEIIGHYYARQAGRIFGVFMEASSDYWLYGHLNFLVFSKMMWDTKCDYKAFLEEYYFRMFGSAATPMKEFFQTLERHWLKDFYSSVVETPVGPVGAPPSDYEVWTKLYSPEEMTRIGNLFDQAEKSVASDSESLKRVKFMRLQMWGPMEQGAKDYFRKAADKDKWTARFPRLAPDKKIVIDGKPDDAAWAEAGEVELVPFGQDDAEVHTIVKMLKDDENYCFLFDCREPETEKMRIVDRKTDDPMLWSDNAVEIYLDTEGARSEYRQIIVNSTGKISDLHVIPSILKSDWSWNSLAEVATSIVPGKGWYAEIRIPRASFPPEKTDRIVANFTRHRVLNGNKVHPYYMWSIYGKEFGDVANFGLLTDSKPSINLFPDGDFRRAGSERKPFQGEWFNWGGRLQRDTAIFRTAGVSIKLEGKHRSIVHYLPELKPETHYRLSFFIRLENVKLRKKGGGFYVRIDDGNGTVRYFPKQPYHGTIPWMRLEYEYQTSKNLTGKAYIHFVLREADGAAWVDGAELIELPAK